MQHTRTVVVPIRLTGVTAAERGAAVPEEPLPAAVREAAQRERGELRQLLASLGREAQALRTRPRVPLEELRRIAVELGVAIAARLTHSRIAAGEYGIEELVRGAVERLPGPAPVTVRLHPDDLARLQQTLEATPAEWAGHDVRFVPDATLGRGDCRAEADDFGVWSEVERGLWELRDLLLESLPAGLVDAAGGMGPIE